MLDRVTLLAEDALELSIEVFAVVFNGGRMPGRHGVSQPLKRADPGGFEQPVVADRRKPERRIEVLDNEFDPAGVGFDEVEQRLEFRLLNVASMIWPGSIEIDHQPIATPSDSLHL